MDFVEPIRMEFDCSCFRRMIDILINCVMNHNSGEYLVKLNNHWLLRKYCILNVFSFMISSIYFFSCLHFFSFTPHLN
jgi:hypothetical protein